MIDFKRYSELFARIDRAFCKYGVFNVGDRCIKTTPTRVRATDSMTVFTIDFRCECGEYETENRMDVVMDDRQSTIEQNIRIALREINALMKFDEMKGGEKK